MVGRPSEADRSGPVGSDADLLALWSDRLLRAVTEALPHWVAAAVEARLPAGTQADEADVSAAAAGAVDAVVPRLEAFLREDVDQQTTTPLTILRAAVTFPTGVLERAQVPPVHRDPQDERLFPDDRYHLTPASFADLGPEVHEAGMAWGAAKAHLHLQRRAGRSRRSGPDERR